MPTRWLSLFGSPRDSRPGDGQAINGDGFSHRVSLLLRRGGIAHFRFGGIADMGGFAAGSTRSRMT